jgi:flagellin
MALSVRTNVASIRAASQLNNTQSRLTNSLERISSGLRVNRAADDAAGMTVATRMEADNVSLKQAIRNANDGVSMIQTAEGGLSEVYNILVRMRELSVQASNETYNSGDRLQMNTEFTELTTEIKRIASTANFNRSSLLNATTKFTLQIGLDNNSDNQLVIRLSQIAATFSALQLEGTTALATHGVGDIGTNGITTMGRAASAIGVIDDALKLVNTRRAYLGAIQNRLESALNEATSYSENLSASSSQIMDVDYAEESARMTRYQIMQQAGVAALGQAKAIPQSIVSLLS